MRGPLDNRGFAEMMKLPIRPVEAKASDYDLMHVGFALSLINQVEAARVFDFLERMNQLDELEVPPP
jgi:hydrogenase expression/formation protein HypC